MKNMSGEYSKTSSQLTATTTNTTTSTSSYHQKQQQQHQHQRSRSLFEAPNEFHSSNQAEPLKFARRGELYAQSSPTNQVKFSGRAGVDQSNLKHTNDTTTASNLNKWWRPCWNGQQLDGELLFEQVKARQERRLMMVANNDRANEQTSTQVVLGEQLGDGRRQQADTGLVYAVPRRASVVVGNNENKSSHQPLSLLESQQPASCGTFSALPTTTCLSSGESISPEAPVRRSSNRQQAPGRPTVARAWRRTTNVATLSNGCGLVDDDSTNSPVVDEEEEDPLSVPLYASVLGTSKQLQAMTEQRRQKQRETTGRANGLQTSIPTRVQAKFERSSNQLDETSAILFNDNNNHHQSEKKLGDETSSLVESCLEVQRATRNGNLLLLINQEDSSSSSCQASSHQESAEIIPLAKSSETQLPSLSNELKLLNLRAGNSNSPTSTTTTNTTTITTTPSGGSGHNSATNNQGPAAEVESTKTADEEHQGTRESDFKCPKTTATTPTNTYSSGSGDQPKSGAESNLDALEIMSLNELRAGDNENEHADGHHHSEPDGQSKSDGSGNSDSDERPLKASSESKSTESDTSETSPVAVSAATPLTANLDLKQCRVDCPSLTLNTPQSGCGSTTTTTTTPSKLAPREMIESDAAEPNELNRHVVASREDNSTLDQNQLSTSSNQSQTSPVSRQPRAEMGQPECTRVSSSPSPSAPSLLQQQTPTTISDGDGGEQLDLSMPQDTSENEIVVKSNDELWQQMKGSSIRVIEITSNLIENKTNDPAAICNKDQQEASQEDSILSDSNNDKTTTATSSLATAKMSRLRDEVIKADECNNLDKFFDHYKDNVWHTEHFFCTECKIPLDGHHYIIVDQTLNQAGSRQHQEQQEQQERQEQQQKQEQQEQQQQKQQQQKQQQLSENGNDDNSSLRTPNNLNNNNTCQPYCLKCFDRIFGETCAQCDKLISCDSGAINHELLSWHASDDCFKCLHCLKSLLGCPFLPNQDGNIYCSMGCSEMSSNSTATTTANATNPFIATSQHNHDKQTLPTWANMSLSNHLDPPHTKMTSNVQQHVEVSRLNNQTLLTNTSNKLANGVASLETSAAPTNGAWDSLLFHKPLIDYLMISAHNDETSYQLLHHLQARFNKSLQDKLKIESNGNKRSTLRDELKLLGEINYTLNKLRASNKHLDLGSAASATKITEKQEQLRRDKLNPFLADVPQYQQQQQQAAAIANSQQQCNSIVCMMTDQTPSGGAYDGGDLATRLGYMNIDSIGLTETTKRFNSEQNLVKLSQHRDRLPAPGLDCIDRGMGATEAGTIAGQEQHHHHHHQRQQQQQLARLVGGAPRQQQHQHQQQQSKLSQCSPVASIISNEGTISDHSATSSGVSSAMAQPGRDSTNGSLKSHSPLSSTSSHSSVVSSSSMMSSASTAAAAAAQQPKHVNQLNEKQHSNQLMMTQSTNSTKTTANTTSITSGSATGNEQTTSVRHSPAAICSIAATLERRRRVQPITELSVVDLLAAADNQMQTSMGPQLVGPELSQSLSSASFDTASASANDGFDQLVSQFAKNTKNNYKLQQQQQQRTNVGLRGSIAQSSRPSDGSLGRQKTFGSGKQQPYSFFFELAQRLPRATRNNSSNSNNNNNNNNANNNTEPDQRMQQNIGLHVATNGPLDTNGLPTSEEANILVASSAQAMGTRNVAPSGAQAATTCSPLVATGSTARMITDHYSTVNKAHKKQQQQQQQEAGGDELEKHDDSRRRTRDHFFAITSPLLDCQLDALTTADNIATPQKAAEETDVSRYQRQSQMMRPTSTLSIFASDPYTTMSPTTSGDCSGGFAAASAQQGSYSTNSLNRQQVGQMRLSLQSTKAPTTSDDRQPITKPSSKPLTRPAKSVSFDPNVKDPPTSSTLGRASAMKQGPPNWHQSHNNQQDMFACPELETIMSQRQAMQSIASSATMPASFAAQLKAQATSSMAAYNAYYDEFGRRIKLSTLLQQQQQLQQQQVLDPATVANLNLAEEQECQQQHEQLNQNSKANTSSSPLPGGSLLAKLVGVSSSSRGGRREERKMRQQENQQQVIQTQPSFIHPMVGPLPAGDFGTIQMHQRPAMTNDLAAAQANGDEPPNEASPSAVVGRSASSLSGSLRRSRRRSSSCQRHSSARSYRRYRRDRRARSHHRQASRRMPARCTSRHCRDEKCLYDSDEDDYSSSCSTCSSSSSTCADNDDYTDYESEHHHRRRRHHYSSSKRSKRSAAYESDDASSCTSYTSPSDSSSEEDAYDEEEDEGDEEEEVENRRLRTSNSSSARSSSPSFRSVRARRVDRKRRSSCSSSSHHSVARSRTSSSHSSSRSRRKNRPTT